MKTRLLSLALLLACQAATLTLDARTTPRHRTRNPNTKVTALGAGAEKGDSVKAAFEENAPSSRSIEGIPRFAIVGKENKFYMGIGANMKLNGVLDWGDDAPSAMDFVPADFTPSSPGNRQNLRFTAQESNVYLNIVALPGQKNRFSLFMACDFKGQNYQFKLSHFYARYRGLTIGYTDSPFTDGDAVPYTIDGEGPNGAVSYKAVVAYWTQDFGGGLSGLIGIDAPSQSMAYDDKVGEVNQRIVAVPAALQYRWGDGSHVRLSGLLRPMQYRDLERECNRGVCGWGVQLSGLAAITPRLVAYYDATYGHGISDYFNDGAQFGGDATPDLRHPGRMDMTRVWGISAGLGYQIMDNLAAHALYSQMRVYPHAGAGATEPGYSYGQYAAANLMYNINQFVTVGMEYDWGLRASMSGEKLKVNRLQALFSLAF